MSRPGRPRWIVPAVAAASICAGVTGCGEPLDDRLADLLFEPATARTPLAETASGTATPGFGLLESRGSASVALAEDAAEPSPGLISGRVVDALSGLPVAGARVSAGGGETDETDGEGGYRLGLPLGRHTLRVTAGGYDGATRFGVTAGLEPTQVDFVLPPVDVAPDDMPRAADRLREALAGATLAGAALDVSGTGAEEPVSIEAVLEVPTVIRVLMPEGEIVEMPTDEYLKGVVPAEMGYVFRRAADALRAQAIASRTYAATSCLPKSAGDPSRCEPGLDANVDTTTKTQVWRPVHYDASDAAVDATIGQAARHDGQLVHALFFARTAERTLNSEESPCCSGNAWPYLRSVGSPDAFAERLGHGAGMSQEGAAVLADWGATADEIVAHYYTGVVIDPVWTPTPTSAPDEAEAMAEAPVGPYTPPVRSGEAVFVGEDLVPDGGGVTGSSDEAWLETPVVAADWEFMALGVRWEGEAGLRDGLAIEARTSRDGIEWSDWTVVPGDDADLKSQDPVGEVWTQLLVARGSYAQIRLAFEGADSPQLADRLTVHYLNADVGPAAPTLLDQAVGPAVVSRAGWGADEGLRFDADGREIWPPEYTTPRAQIVHHTVTTNDPADPAAVVRAVYHYHAVSRGWGDIGYNFLIDHRGNVYEGRYGGERASAIVQGGHALQYNPNTIGVALLGTFTEASTRPSAPAEAALVELLAAKGLRYGIDPYAPVTLAGTGFGDSVLGHRDVLPGHTVCPGDGLYARLESIRSAVARRMQDGDAAPTATQRPPTAAPPTVTPRPATATPRPATATATRVPTATPLPPPGCVDLVRDGGFEESAGAWTTSRAYVTQWDVYRGQNAMFVGLRNDEPDLGTSYSSALQTLRVPDKVGRAVLRFYAATQGDAADRRLVRILDGDGAVVAGGDLSLPAVSSWNLYEVDVTSALAGRPGQAVRLYFGTVNNGDGARTYMRLDDAALIVCPAGAASASPAPTGTRTATAAATATRTASATAARPTSLPQATGTPAHGGDEVVCVDVVLSGGFEDPAADDWRLGGDHRAEVAEGGAAGSARSVRLGLLAQDDDRFGFASAAQDLRLPDGTVTATLQLRILAESVSPEDSFVAEIRRTSDGRRTRLLGPEALPGGDGWSERVATWDPASMGPDVQIYFATLNRGQAAAGRGATSVLLDDVRVWACYRPSASSRFIPWSATAGP